ncbi:MAG TPA: DUF721 domain-containing protein [Planctomycetaceae bacterium]|nr:DUF721 domain-containing protein [Planctomycetaceae bacterium]
MSVGASVGECGAVASRVWESFGEWKAMAPGPERIDRILAELMARSGYGRVQAAATWEAAWREVVGRELAGQTRVGRLRRGRLDVIVVNSTLLQEMAFRKAELVKALQRRLPDEGLREIRFRVGTVD